MKCEYTLIGEIPGYKVEAITDMCGPQCVVVTENKTFISEPQENHGKAVDLANLVWEGRVDYRKWSGAIDSISEFFTALSKCVS